jgi:ArsR family transcriptional regulator, arsenate/arsenite/antimonite-responsive transcriptional repressor
MEDTFQALSSGVRRKILAYLSKASLTAGEIAERFEISKPALSKHLSILQNAGLIEGEKKGQFVHYRLAKDNLFASMNDFLVNFCPEGRPLKMESAKIAKDKKQQEPE